MKLRSLTLYCLAVLFVALLAGCGGGGGGGSTVSGTSSDTSSSTTNPVPTATPVQNGTVNLNLQFGAAGKPEQKSADAATVGLPAATSNVLVHLVNPANNQDVVPPVQQAHKAGATEETVVFTNVPYGSWKVIVQALAADNSVLGFYNSTVGVASSSTTVTVNSSVTLKSLAITPATATINTGASQQFTATGTFSDGSTSDMSSVATWSSSVPAVASVERGKCVGLTAGQSFIVALLADQNATGTLTVVQQVGPTPTPSVTPSPSPSASPTYVGTAVCAQCHTSGPYANMYHAGDPIDGTPSSPTYMDLQAYGSIYNNYVSSVHYTPNGTQLTDAVKCEGCHGPGSQHYGVGPIPYYMPSVAQCGSCHGQTGNNVAAEDTIDITAYNATLHANADKLPDKYFFNGGVGTAQADYHGAPEFKQDGTAVNKNEHIEECGVCHTPDQKMSHIQTGDVQDPPQIGCASCHDPHNPAQKVRNYVTSRTANASDSSVDPFLVPNLKPVQVNNTGTPGVTAMFGAMNKVTGTWIRPRIYFGWHVGGDTNANFSGYTAQTSVNSGDVLRLSTDRLCASCHTKGTYKYGYTAGTFLTNGTTHQTDVYTQWINSGHGDKTLAPWEEFSLLTTSTSHRPQYPIDMGAKPGQNGWPSGTANRVAFDGRINGGADNFACYQCHHGIGAIDYTNATVAGNAIGDTKQTHILWGDSSVTCVTCHDPHKSGAGATKNVRVPVLIAYNDEFKPQRTPTGSGNARGGVNSFLDLTPLPTGMGNNAICLQCHQGRESGWTAWNKVRWARMTAPNTDTSTVAANFWYDPLKQDTKITNTFGFINDHYLAAGSLLYGRNCDEYSLDGTTPGTIDPATVKQYSDGIPKHIEKGCVGCHMANIDDVAKIGGHTFKPNIKTCQECHAGVQTFEDILAPLDYDGSGVRGTVAEEIGTIAVINHTVVQGQAYSTGQGGTGLLGEINATLYDKYGIIYDPNTYPYTYKWNGTALVTFNGFTPRQLKAAENLQKLVKTNGAIYVHNPFYASQIIIDGLNDMGVTIGRQANGTAGVAFGRPTTAAGGTTHSARDYRTLNP